MIKCNTSPTSARHVLGQKNQVQKSLLIKFVLPSSATSRDQRTNPRPSLGHINHTHTKPHPEIVIAKLCKWDEAFIFHVHIVLKVMVSMGNEKMKKLSFEILSPWVGRWKWSTAEHLWSMLPPLKFRMVPPRGPVWASAHNSCAEETILKQRGSIASLTFICNISLPAMRAFGTGVTWSILERAKLLLVLLARARAAAAWVCVRGSSWAHVRAGEPV